jgi:threonine dehydrogenase-like Zn-dependent dehydrogenase
MPKTRHVAKHDGHGRLSIEEEELPSLEVGELLIDVDTAMISNGTHGGWVRRRREDPDPDAEPGVIGYQSAGTVLQTGSEVEGFAAGDRVACMGSGYAIQATHNVVPVNLCTPLPEEVSFEEAAANHLACTALNGVRRGELDLGAYVAVVGLGLVGQFTAQIAAISGTNVLGVDLYEQRLDCAQGADIHYTIASAKEDFSAIAESFSGGHGIDTGFLCIGGDANQAFEDLHNSMLTGPDGEPLGTIVITGGVDLSVRWDASVGRVDLRNASRTGPGYRDHDFERGAEYTEGYVRWTTPANLQTVIEWMRRGELRVEPLITHRYHLSDIDDAYDTVVEDPSETLGVIVDCDL